jgi:aspartyl-tRNA(Asn)/glutamyl-tRNA(Gln) amidotransferase subunit A
MGNLMGLTAVSLPAGAPSCGIMLNALPGQEGRLLRLAAAAEATLA